MSSSYEPQEPWSHETASCPAPLEPRRAVSELCWGVLKNPVGVFTIKIQTQLYKYGDVLVLFFLCIYIYIVFCVYHISTKRWILHSHFGLLDPVF